MAEKEERRIEQIPTIEKIPETVEKHREDFEQGEVRGEVIRDTIPPPSPLPDPPSPKPEDKGD